MFFNELDAPRALLSAEYIGFERKEAITDQDGMEDPSHSIPPQPYKLNHVRTLWQYTSCCLSNVTEIHLCVDIKASFRPVVGMLLYYSDGHRECVGQMRLDHMAETIPIAKTDILSFRSKETAEGMKYIDLVTTQAPEVRKDCWLDVYLCGTLEWWFWAERHVLRYAGASLNIVE